ncbi:MAG: tRNA (adenosine(37)-N6)-threonylcarbamoyltransferase complex ATPase subunit type 1 TsaE [Pseudomonadota bacterium]
MSQPSRTSDLVCTIASEEAMVHFAAHWASVIKPGLWLGLSGDLGVGKTTFVRHMLYALGWASSVKSPTFTLVEPYALPNLKVYHFDWYRLESPEELEYIGIRDYVQSDALVLVEWLERAAPYFYAHGDLLFTFSYHNEGRQVTVSALSMEGERCISTLRGVPGFLHSFLS